MVIVQDTREQLPFKFIIDEALSGVEVKTLSVADYACILDDGSWCPIRFERKNVSDLYGTMTSGYKRFKREVNLANELGIKMLLIIEGTFADVARGSKHSLFDGRSMIRKLMTLWLRYDLIPIFCESRSEAAAYIKCFFEAFNKSLKRKVGNGTSRGIRQTWGLEHLG